MVLKSWTHRKELAGKLARLEMIKLLEPVVVAGGLEPLCLPICPSDSLQLGDLLFEAYKGTVDDQGETLDEARQEAVDTLNGKYGPLIQETSFKVEDEAKIIAASVVVDYKGPFLAYVAVLPEYQGKGLAKALILRVLAQLYKSKADCIRLVVTQANIPAINLYRKLGFSEMHK